MLKVGCFSEGARRAWLALIAGVLLQGCAARSEMCCAVGEGAGASGEHGPVVFTAMGCGPYNAAAERALARFIATENRLKTSEFIVHLGDIVTGANRQWPESQYIKVAEILKKDNEIPTFSVPGDNEWNDRLDPDVGWEYWTRHYLRMDEGWKFEPRVDRQKEREENFAFVLRGVLFIGINKVGGRIHDVEEWERRLSDNARWIRTQFRRHGGHVRAAVILAQATPETVKTLDKKRANLDPFFLNPFRRAARKFGKPILYMHADGHRWFYLAHQWETNILHVQTDIISAEFPPPQVTVTMDPTQPFRFDWRLDDPVWKK